VAPRKDVFNQHCFQLGLQLALDFAWRADERHGGERREEGEPPWDPTFQLFPICAFWVIESQLYSCEERQAAFRPRFLQVSADLVTGMDGEFEPL